MVAPDSASIATCIQGEFANIVTRSSFILAENGRYFKRIPKKSFGHVMSSLPACTALECASRCSRNVHCKSFTFSKKQPAMNLPCRLSNYTAEMVLSRFIDSPDDFYYEMV